MGGAVVLGIADVLDHLEPATVASRVEVALGRLDVVLKDRPAVVVADLGPVCPSRLVVGLLGIVRRRAARAGAALVLVDPSSAVQACLDQARVAALYTTATTVDSALHALTATPRVGDPCRPAADGEAACTG